MHLLSVEQMARSCPARLLTVPLLLICGEGRFFVIMVLERRYGPRRLPGPDVGGDGGGTVFAVITVSLSVHARALKLLIRN